MSRTDSRGVGRRRFLVTGAAATAALAASQRAAEAAAGPLVAVVRDKTKKVVSKRTIDAAIVQRLVDHAVMTVAGVDDIAKAWAKFVSPTDKVAVKFNGLFPRATTSAEVVFAVTTSLVKGGVDPKNIVVYDRSDKDVGKARMEVKRDGAGPFIYGTEGNYGPEVKAGPVTTRLSKILLDADVLINVPVLKTHVLSGVTGAMKNHLGTVNNASKFHRDEKRANNCRFVADISALEPIKTKTRLCIADALTGQYDRGPGYSARHRWDYYGIVAGADFVALDAVLADLIRAKRIEKGLSPDFKPFRHLERAVELGLGEGDLKKINRVEADI